MVNIRICFGNRCRQAAQDNIGAIARGDDEGSVTDMIQKMRQIHGGNFNIEYFALQAIRITLQDPASQVSRDFPDSRFAQQRLLGKEIHRFFNECFIFKTRVDQTNILRFHPINQNCQDGTSLIFKGIPGKPSRIENFLR